MTFDAVGYSGKNCSSDLKIWVILFFLFDIILSLLLEGKLLSRNIGSLVSKLYPQ